MPGAIVSWVSSQAMMRGNGARGARCAGRGAALSQGPVAAAPLPAHLAPRAPFPRIIACELTHETIAPGIERASYRILTTAGPLHVALVIADPANRWVRFDTVLAHDALGGTLESVSSMAPRTGAVGGINGDYYAVGAGLAPLGLVVRHAATLHVGATRPALATVSHRGARIGTLGAGGVLNGVVTAIGGGPVLLRNGRIADDSGSTNYADRAMRIPASVLVLSLIHISEPTRQ